MDAFMTGFGDELIKIAVSGETVARKGKAAAKGALIGAGSAVSFPALAAMLIAKRGGKLRAGKDALRLMTGSVPQRYRKNRFDRDMADEVAGIGGRITGAAGMTGAGLGALLG